jgi:signal transduction histidine kinase
MAKNKSNHVETDADKVQKIDRDELADLVVSAANKYQKDGSRVAYYLDEQERSVKCD